MRAPTTQTLLTQWNWEPSVLIGIVALTAVYFYGTGPLRRAHNWGDAPSRSQMMYFAMSQLLLLGALISPLDGISDTYLFSGHMVQHLLLAALWPPLILLATPAWVARLAVRSAVGGLFQAFTQPVLALALFNLDIYLWHIPALYNLTLSNEPIHILEHLTFLGFGALNWWPVLSPAHEQRLSSPLQVLYLLVDGMFMMVLGIVLTFSPVIFYSAYVSAPRLWGISASTDQQIGGLIMWYPGNLPYAWLLIVAFYTWFNAGGAPTDGQRIAAQSPTIGPPGP